MPKESNLGPLWEHAPKSRGFRISIPDPAEISYWVQQTSSSRGGFTQEEILEQETLQMEQFVTRQSNRFLPTERVWKVDIGDDLLSAIIVVLHAAYSPERGEWGDICFYIGLSTQAKAEGKHWEIPLQATNIVKRLQDKGFNVSAEQDSDKSWSIIIPNKTGGSVIDVYLGYVTPEDIALGDDTEYVPLLVRPIEFPISLPRSMENLQHLQITTSHFIDSLYEVLDMEPPNIVFEISQENELN